MFRIVTPSDPEYSQHDPRKNYAMGGGVIVTSLRVSGGIITHGGRRYHVHPPNGINLHRAYGIRWSETI